MGKAMSVLANGRRQRSFRQTFINSGSSVRPKVAIELASRIGFETRARARLRAEMPTCVRERAIARTRAAYDYSDYSLRL